MTEETSTNSKLIDAFQKILPLVDDLADGLGVLLLISTAFCLWIFLYCFQLQYFSLIVCLTISGLALVPILILSRIWFALENLKDIPKVAEDLIDDVSDDAAQSWHAIKSGKKGALNFWGQAKKMFEIRSILNSADDIIGQYFSIGPLVNPFYLFLSALSFVGLFFIVMLGGLLGVLAIFA